MHSHGKPKGVLPDFASSTTQRRFVAYSSDANPSEQEDVQGLLKATRNQFQNVPAKMKKCNCKLDPNEKLLLGWELYKPRKFYVNTNQTSRSNSSDVLRHLLIDRIRKKNQHGRPTALTRLIDEMKKPASSPDYEYGNCLQKRLIFDDHKMQYLFGGKMAYTPPNIDEIYLSANGSQKQARRNPFAAVQLCPVSFYEMMEQPAGQEYVTRGTNLIDPKTL